MDDVHYLRKYADEESFLFVVDSSRRDVAVNPRANEYEVQFNAPFRNVVGLDLLDATIPRTEYLVEAGANSLAYTHGGVRRTATVPPGDYNLLQLAEALNAALAPHLTVAVTTTPPEVSNKVRLLSEGAFTLHVSESTLRRSLGLGVGGLLASTLVPGALGERTVVAGPLPATHEVAAQPPVAQRFAAPAAGTFTGASVYLRSPEAGQTVRVAVVRVSDGTAAAEGSADTTGVDFEQVAVTFASSATVAAGDLFYLVVDCPDGTVFTDGGGLWGLVPDPGGQAWWAGVFQPLHVGDTAGAMCADVAMLVDGHRVEPPDVVDLTGEPYVLVRCPEIEQQLYRDRAFERVHAGLGLVKLGNYGFREQRFDFTSFPPRRLPNPIGKLSKLTVRLEKGDGTLYDTKGINHHLVLVIKYLEITKGPDALAAPTSSLNPHYLPNPLHYLQRHGR